MKTVQRTIITKIDDVIELFKDYLSEDDLPRDAKPLRLFVRPGDRKVGILCESKSWNDVGKLVEIPVKFQLRRIYTV